MMQQDERGSDLGSTLRGVIQKYGPLAAVALPALVFALNRGGGQALKIIEKYAPQHLRAAQRSHYPYVVGSQPITSGSPSFVDSYLGESMIPQEISALVRERTGKVPTRLTYLNVHPKDLEGPMGEHVTMHEFGHLTGHNRVLNQFPGAETVAVARLGQNHLDKLVEPRVQRQIAAELQKNPTMQQYLGHRLVSDLTPTTAAGETLNDMWARRIRGPQAQSLDPQPYLQQHGRVGASPIDYTSVWRLGQQGLEDLRSMTETGQLSPERQRKLIAVYDMLLDTLRSDPKTTQYLRNP